MRILVVSDLHGNAAALDAIREPFDVCLCLGDLVEYGPEPIPCIRWVQEHATHTVRGNHDHGAAHEVDIIGSGGFRYLTMATRKQTIAQLSDVDRSYLAELPVSAVFDLEGKRFMMVHASPRDAMDEYVPPDPEAWAPRIAGLRVDYLCVGHTHVPFTTTIGRTTIVNPGSVGLSRDGNPKARYAIIDDGRVELKQIDYDIERTVAAVQAADLEAQAKAMLTEVYRKGRYVQPNGNGKNPILQEEAKVP